MIIIDWLRSFSLRFVCNNNVKINWNKYKIYYALLYEFPDNSLFPENEEVDLEEDLQPEPADGYIIFDVEESDIGD